jgi:RimJ/RimL family protein N-acetyltransferase
LKLSLPADTDAAELLEAVEESRADMGAVGWAEFVTDTATAAAALGALHASGAYVVRVGGRLVGVVALQPMDDGALNLACWIRVSAQRLGHATAACTRVLMGARGARIVADPPAENFRSVAAVARLRAQKVL